MISETQPRLVSIPEVQEAVRAGRTHGGRRRWIAWVAAVVALVVIGALAFVAIRQTGALADTRERLAVQTAAAEDLRARLTDVTDDKDDLAQENGRLGTTVDTCREAAELSSGFNEAVKDVFRALYVDDREAFVDGFRNMAKIGRRAESATRSCLNQSEPQVSTV